MHLSKALHDLPTKELAVSVGVVPEGGHREDDLTLLRVVAYTIAILYHRTKTEEYGVALNWYLQERNRSSVTYNQLQLLFLEEFRLIFKISLLGA